MPGSASVAGIDPSIDWASGWSAGVPVTFLPRFVKALAMAEWSIGRLASWWNTVRLRIIV